MKWTEVKYETSSEAVEAVSNIFIEAGAQGVAIEDAMDLANFQNDEFGEILDKEHFDFIKEGAYVTSYFPETTFLPEILPTIKERLAKLPDFGLSLGADKWHYQELSEDDWANAWKKYYRPVPISRFLTIVPEWLDYEPKHEDERIIKMDPGMAFGTGSHPTTRLTLQALETIIRGGEKVLDVGTGSGILSIASKLFGASEVIGYDLDEVAVNQAQSNVKLNPAVGNIPMYANDLLTGVNEEADIIVANILADIIVRLMDDAWRLTKEEGHFVVSGIIEDKKAMIIAEAQQRGFKLEQTLNQGDWYAFIFVKPGMED